MLCVPIYKGDGAIPRSEICRHIQTGVLSLRPFATFAMLRDYAAVSYLMARQLHSATDVERVLPAGAESQARHPHNTAVTVTPIPYNGASATRAVMSPTCRNAVYNDGALRFIFPCWFRSR